MDKTQPTQSDREKYIAMRPTCHFQLMGTCEHPKYRGRYILCSRQNCPRIEEGRTAQKPNRQGSVK